MMSLPAGGHIGIETHLLHILGRRLTVITTVHGRRDLLLLPVGILGRRDPGLFQILQRGLGQGHGLLFVVGRVGHVTGYDNLVRFIDTRLGVAAVIPALVVGLHHLQLGIGKVGLGLVVGNLADRPGLFTPSFLARALPLGFCLLPALPFGLRLGLSLLFQTLLGGPDDGQT